MDEKITKKHLMRKAIVYVRQSSPYQVQHNTESRRLQYAMKQRVQTLGWREVEVIDDDLGQSATTATKREGFQRMVAEVCLGKVGAVAAREASRFARNNRDWHQLVEMCSLVDTLLIDLDSIYNPRQGNDRLLLGLKGSLSEYELDLLRQRSLEARRAKARRGELVITAPVGFLKTIDQKIEKDPDSRVQHTIALVFEKFFELGSARQALMWFLENNIQIPARSHETGEWTTIWKRPAYQALMHILKEPTYAGAYAYGKSKAKTRVVNGVLEKKRVMKPLSEYAVLIQDHHEGYITWEQFDRIQKMISDNVNSFMSQRPGAVKKGPSLLAGLLRCRRCGKKLVVGYVGKERQILRYSCQRGYLDNGDPKCISFGGAAVDAAVAREILRIVEPRAIEAATLAASDENHQQDDIIDTLLLELKAARYAADRAGKQFDASDPDNRLVVDELERRWNSALERVCEIENRIEQEQQVRKKQDNTAGIESLTDLAMDLERVWNHPETDVRLKKRILRTMISEVVVDIDTQASEIEIVIHWKGGIHSSHRVPRRRRGQNSLHTSTDTVDAVRQLSLICSDEMIAGVLNRNGLLTGRGNRWTRERVTSLRSHRKIPVYKPTEQSRKEWLNLSDAADYLNVTPKTLRRAVERKAIEGLHPLPDGPWVFTRTNLDDAIHRELFESSKSTPAGPDSKQLTLTISGT